MVLPTIGPIEPCRAYVDRQKKSGTDVAVAPQLVWIAQILYSLAGERYGFSFEVLVGSLPSRGRSLSAAIET
jgi:hypothetical protein